MDRWKRRPVLPSRQGMLASEAVHDSFATTPVKLEAGDARIAVDMTQCLAPPVSASLPVKCTPPSSGVRGSGD